MTDHINWRAMSARLADAARPYVDNAAPHEQLFSATDLRNYEYLARVLAEYDRVAVRERVVEIRPNPFEVEMEQS